jgi:hypothetical protein
MFEIGHIIFILWLCPAFCCRDVGFSTLNPGATTLLADKEASLFFPIKSSPVTGLEWPRGFQEVKVPRLLDNGTGWWQGCQPYAPAVFTPRKYSRYSFQSETESTPGPQYDRKDLCQRKNSMPPSGIEPATFRFVAQTLTTVLPRSPVFSPIVFVFRSTSKFLRKVQ